MTLDPVLLRELMVAPGAAFGEDTPMVENGLTYQQGFELKCELLTPLPYSGRAVGSIDHHQDFFSRSFDIQADGAPAHTGCLGFGLERLALAFIAQHGVDEHSRPAWIAER